MIPPTNTMPGADRGTLFRTYSDAWFGHRRLLNNRDSFTRQHGDTAFGAALSQAEHAMAQAHAAYIRQPLEPQVATSSTPAARPPGMLGDAFGKVGS